MKKLSFILLFVIVLNQLLSAQVNVDSSRPAQLTDRELGLQYLKKANTQRAVGWVLLGAGLAMEIIAMSAVADDFSSDPTGLVMVGGILMIASVPIFAYGAKNRGRAEILLRHENIRVYNNSGSGKESMVSMGLSIPLGRSRK